MDVNVSHPVPLNVPVETSGVDESFIAQVTGVAPEKFLNRISREEIDGKVVTFLPDLNAVVIRTKHIGSGAFKNCFKGLFVPIDNPQICGWVADLEAVVSVEEDADMMRNEYKLATSLPEHPNLDRPLAFVDTYSLGASKNVGTINLLADGDTSKEVPANLKETITICRDLARGYQVLHENKIIHADGKPANALITRSGSEIAAKITDYGLCYANKDKKTLGEIKRGTLSWMAPETLDEIPESGGPERDVWSLLVIAYQLYVDYRDEETGELLDPMFVVYAERGSGENIKEFKEELEFLSETLEMNNESAGEAEVAFRTIIQDGLQATWNKRPTAEHLANQFDALLVQL